ncbi:hypothetical protein GCM10023080_031260 [Streptomyces pseudoechinosporeus]
MGKAGKVDVWLAPGTREDAPCAGAGAKRSARRTPCHGRGGWGGRNRNSPTGGAAKGIPAKRRPPPGSAHPRTVPAAVSVRSASVMA